MSESEVRRHYGLILLAAGASTRMGQPKQLLKLAGRTLLRRAVDAALAADVWPIVVVVGALEDNMRAELAALPVQIAVNAQWEKGMASSLQVGLKTLPQFSRRLDGAIVMLCDQPYLKSSHLDSLLTAANKNPEAPVAYAYADTLGPPTLFPRIFFPELLALESGQGARTVLARQGDRVISLEAPELAIDLDTSEDYQKLLIRFSESG